VRPGARRSTATRLADPDHGRRTLAAEGACRSGGSRDSSRAAIDAGDEDHRRIRACRRSYKNHLGVQCSRATPLSRFTALHFFSRYKNQ